LEGVDWRGGEEGRKGECGKENLGVRERGEKVMRERWWKR
jgi:hypothetical protein